MGFTQGTFLGFVLFFSALIVVGALVAVYWRFGVGQTWRLWRAIQSGDGERIEVARSWVSPKQVPTLIKWYWRERDWSKKRAIVELLQDQFHPQLPRLMLDFLQVPLKDSDDAFELAQAIALGFMGEKYDRFMEYYNDRSLLARDVRAVLIEHGLQAELSSPPLAPQSEQPFTPLFSSNPSHQFLLQSVSSGSLASIERALRAGTPVDVLVEHGTHKGCSALLLALMSKQFDAAALLIEAGADVHFARPNLQGKFVPGRGQTPLWWAAYYGHLRLVEMMIQRGAQVNVPDHYGNTPLMQAAQSGSLEVVRCLVHYGADIHANLETPTEGIADGRKAFHLAVTNGRLEVVEYLLNLGNLPDERDGSGYTPLMIAVENNFYDLADLLIRRGADVNAVHTGSGIYIGLRGWTPLVFAAHAGLVNMTKMLLHAGADARYRVPSGSRPDGVKLPERSLLDFVRGKRAESIIKLLKAFGAQ